MGRFLRWRAEHYKIPVHGGSDPTERDVMLEVEEHLLWRRAQEDPVVAERELYVDDDGHLWEAANKAAKALEDGDEYVAKVTGDEIIDELERQLAAGEDPDLSLLEG